MRLALVVTGICGLLLIGPVVETGLSSVSGPQVEAVRRLSAEVQDKGWIAYSAKSDKGDWDIFLCRPDGSHVRNLTHTPDQSEFAPQFSRDGRRLLFRRAPKGEMLDSNHHGEQGELVAANSDGTEARALGKPGEYPWANWSPDGRQIATLSVKGIFIYNLDGMREVRRLDRKGFFQQMTWSPDGRSLVGVANSFGTSWSIARIDLATGEASAVNRVDCCTPDWCPDSKSVIFSWRPPGQKTNNGYGWTQLWISDGDGKPPRLVYGEDDRHVYGGHVSPDGQYVLFTGNKEEDGDPGHAGAPMGLMRLKDAPIIGGESKDLRALHPKVNNGPVVVLPSGWEPCWTLSELPAGATADKSTGAAAKTASASPSGDPAAGLAAELHGRGWLVFSAKTDRDDWDLYLSRPDGTDRRKLTDTREWNEAGARFSPDGKRLLYYRMPRAEAVDNNTYGTFDLVMADADGGHPVVFGKDFPWASWGPDGTQIACLATKGIEIVDVATRKVVRQIPRKGLVQQLAWSPDGKSFVGTANGLGQYWNIGLLDPATGNLAAVSETDRYNCTPDWLGDSRGILYARGIVPGDGGRAELWVASPDGKERRPLYAEESRHIYGACASPDGKYLLFTRSVEDLGKADGSGITMAVIRMADTPMIGDFGAALRKRIPGARTGPRLDLGPGWEPHWTAADVGGAKSGADK
jgi:Tol biopolymer transport system component